MFDLFEDENFGADNPDIGGPFSNCEVHDRVHEAGAEYGDHGDSQQYEGEGKLDIDKPVYGIVKHAAVVATQDSKHSSDQYRDEDGYRADARRDPCAEDQPG